MLIHSLNVGLGLTVLNYSVLYSGVPRKNRNGPCFQGGFGNLWAEMVRFLGNHDAK